MLLKIAWSKHLPRQVISTSLGSPQLSHRLSRVRATIRYQYAVRYINLSAIWEAACIKANETVHVLGKSSACIAETHARSTTDHCLLHPFQCGKSSTCDNQSTLLLDAAHQEITFLLYRSTPFYL